jgi:predicted AlkP superfamily pyrophosphatase or phosphodiesterase
VTGSAARSWAELPYTPFADELVFTLARELVTRERLGADEVPDLLWISGSAADYIGHRYGPLSQEAQDYYLRLDGWLRDFFAFLDGAVGPDRYTVALSGDHGVLPLPEELARRGLPSRRIVREDLSGILSAAETELQRTLGVSDKLFAGFVEGVLLHYSAAGARGMSPAELQQAVARQLRTLPIVADAYTAAELTAPDTPARPYLEQFRNSFYQDRSPDVVVRFQPMYYVPAYGPFGTSHGTTYDYDTHVPLIFLGVGTRAGVHGDRVATTDLAPTLARLLRIRPTGTIDGKVLEAALR